jgi:hypothetical protein
VGPAGIEWATAKASETAAVPVAVSMRPFRTTRDRDDDKGTVERLLLPEDR